jgi:hypothetical protein
MPDRTTNPDASSSTLDAARRWLGRSSGRVGFRPDAAQQDHGDRHDAADNDDAGHLPEVAQLAASSALTAASARSVPGRALFAVFSPRAFDVLADGRHVSPLCWRTRFRLILRAGLARSIT